MRKLIGPAVIALILAACSPASLTENLAENIAENALEGQSGVDDVNIDVDGDSGQVEFEVTGEDGDSSVVIGGGELPEDFPVDLPSGGQIQAVSTSPDGSLVAIYYSGGDFDDIVDHFQGEADSSGGSDISTYSSTNPSSQAWSWNTSDGGSVTITVSDAGDQILVNVIYGNN